MEKDTNNKIRFLINVKDCEEAKKLANLLKNSINELSKTKDKTPIHLTCLLGTCYSISGSMLLLGYINEVNYELVNSFADNIYDDAIGSILKERKAMKGGDEND